MHDQTGSYGAAGHQTGYGPPPQYGAQYGPQYGPQYGAQPGHGAPPPYGYGPPQPYGQPGPPSPFGYGPPPPRPGGGPVITAGIIQIIQASLFVIIALVILFLADVVNSAGDEFDRQAGADVSDTTDSISLWVALAGLVLLAAAVFMIVLAAVAMRGRRWAAITSVVLQGLSVLATLANLGRSGAGDAPGFTVVFLLASITVIVLFLLPASTAYFADRSARR